MTYEDLLVQLVEKDERYIVMTAENRALIRTIPGRIGNRFIDTGITEQTMIGMAAGLALRGRTPIVHALACFLTMRAYEFIRTDVGIGRLPVKLIGFIPGFLSEANGPTHQAIEDVSIMRGIPGMKIFAPADINELMAGLENVLADPSPYYIRYVSQEAIVDHKPYSEGEIEIFGTGRTMLLSYGLMFNETYKAFLELQEQGYSVGMAHLPTLKPVNSESVIDLARFARRLITVEDHFQTGGLFSILAEELALAGVDTPIHPMALKERWFKPTLLRNVLDVEGFTAEKITANVKRIIEAGRGTLVGANN